MPGYHAKKRLGQNFLKSEAVIRQIVDLVDPVRQPHIVEVGPGRGALTLPLAAAGTPITAVEFDRDLIGYLKKLLEKHPNVVLQHGDFLETTPETLGATRFFLLGNLPYNITSPVLDWTVRYREQVVGALFMVQKEVAERINASPPGKNWSPLSIITQLYFDVEYCFTVKPGSFSPPPQVSSAVLRLTPKTEVKLSHPAQFDSLVRQAFERRRKLLVNNLVPDPIEDAEHLKAAMQEVGLWPNVRAEQMSTEQFITLTDCLVAAGLL
ncbi:MAG TPA: 16S rRNA (adenine(1518)-N(6)/adenine(1519)-N(6))-dimethyltransferase RsmA [candidate division Zixibacteria bacterium]|nr:16S rRNA (adenine(1518)-N(6)/adenine(1519)-N(6))-dimethyltransferase RsmA [candidate division Zixibacteria bacterium]